MYAETRVSNLTSILSQSLVLIFLKILSRIVGLVILLKALRNMTMSKTSALYILFSRLSKFQVSKITFT